MAAYAHADPVALANAPFLFWLKAKGRMLSRSLGEACSSPASEHTHLPRPIYSSPSGAWRPRYST